MPVDKQTTREVEDVDDETEKFLELEEEISRARERNHRTTSATDTRIDLRPSRLTGMCGTGIISAPVISARKSAGEVKFVVAHEGEEHELAVPFPSDPADPSEPLVRLCRWDDTPIDRIADLDSVPVIPTDLGLELFLPSPRREHRTEFVLPGGMTKTLTRESVTSRLERWYTRFKLFLTATPLVKGNVSDASVPLGRGLFLTCLVAATIAVAVWMATSLVMAGFVAAAITFLFCFGTFSDIECDGFDTL